MAVVHYSAITRPECPVISVCIANYNGEELLADCINSVLNQASDAAFEIIVHDDASSDGSVGFLRERFPQAELLVSEDNVGFCIANNRMAAVARGKYVLLLNNDAALAPDALATFLAFARDSAENSILTLPQYDWDTRRVVDRGCLLDLFYNPVPNLDPARRNVAYVIGACLWIPRALWQELGGFPEWMGSVGEDLYLCSVARLRAISVCVLPTSGYRHRQGASFGGNRPESGRLATTFRRRQMSERNKAAALFVCTPSPLAWLLLGLLATTLVLEGVAITLIRRDKQVWRLVYWEAVLWLWRARGSLLSSRKEAQRLRTQSFFAYLAVFRLFPQKLRLLLRHGIPTFR